MEMAISSMDICKNITPKYLDSIRKRIVNSKIIVLDTKSGGRNSKISGIPEKKAAFNT